MPSLTRYSEICRCYRREYKTLMRLDGDRLGRLHKRYRSSVKSIPASSAVAVEIDLTLPRQDTVPAFYPTESPTTSRDPIPWLLPLAKTVDGLVVSVNQTPPIVMSPLAGTGWFALNGCCSPNVHRNTRVGATDRIATSETSPPLIGCGSMKERRQERLHPKRRLRFSLGSQKVRFPMVK